MSVPSAMVVVYIHKKYVSWFVYKYIESTVAIIMITMFGVISFNCGICADSKQRKIFNNDENDQVFIYWCIGVVAHILDLFFYIIMYRGDVLKYDFYSDDYN